MNIKLQVNLDKLLPMRISRILPFLICLTALLARIGPGPRTIDDSYITYRYARNILAGNGFVFNQNEPVQGTTTPLYTLLMVALGFGSGGVNTDFPLISMWVNAFADAVTCYLLIKVGQKMKAEYAGYGASLIWAVAPYSVTFAIGGLETSVYILLLTSTIWFYLTGKQPWMALTAALALLTRPDALILLAPIALDFLIQILRHKAKLHLREIVIFTLPVILWYGFAWISFGSPFPHSVQAKLIAYRLEPFSALIRLIQHYATPFLEHLWFTTKWMWVGVVLYPFLFVLGARKLFRTDPKILPWLIYPWLYFLAFSLPNPLIFRWYLSPPLPVYFFVLLFGLEILILNLIRNRLAHQYSRLIAVVFVILLPLISTLRGWELHPDHGPNRPAPTMAWFKLELLYRQAADIINPYLSPASVLAAGDVGVLGYYTPARILDTVGLNSAESIKYYPLDERFYEINYAIAPDLILDQKPDWLVFLEVYGRKGLLLNPRFSENYALFQKLDTDIYGSQGMLIYQCITCSN